MLRIKSFLFMAAGVAAMTFVGTGFAQDCASCGPGQNYFAHGGGASMGYVSGGADFGYPVQSGGCGSCGGVSSIGGGGGCSCGQEIRQRWDHARQISAKVAARNQAWPKPFNCADRQLYFSIWEPMMNAGYQQHATLTGAHFYADSNELNKYGQSAVASIMQNLPQNRQTIFIVRNTDQESSEFRMQEVRSTIDKWYGNRPAPTLAFTDRMPLRGSGFRAENIGRLSTEGAPSPIIPVASGSGAINNTAN